MLLIGKGLLLSQETKTSKKTGNSYNIITVLDGSQTFQMLSQTPILGVNQLQQIEFVCDVKQGKYPKYEFVKINK